MQIFNLTLQQMLLMFSLILVGFLLRKKSLLPENAGTVMAKLESFLFIPALQLSNQLAKCTVTTFMENGPLVLLGLVITLIAILLSFPLARCFVKKTENSPEKQYERSVYQYALTFGNYGFVGNFLVLGVWGSDVFYKYSLFVFFVGILCCSWGLYLLTPKDGHKGMLYNIKKGVLTPTVISMVLGVVLGLLDLTKYIPNFIVRALDSVGKCQGPVAMLIAGFIIGGFDLKKLLFNKKVYVATAMRLVVLPALLMLVMRLLGTNDELMTLTLVAFATPLGLYTIIHPAAFGGDTKIGASMVAISHILAVVTIPLMYLLFIVVL